MKSSSTQPKIKQEELDSSEELIERFNAAIQSSLPNGLNSPLSKRERALLRTFILWQSSPGGRPSLDRQEEASFVE
jgi:hypothetical protein